MNKGTEEENPTVEEKISTNENDTQINNLAKETLLAAINQSQSKENKVKIDNYDLTNEKDSSSDEWKEEKSDSKDALRKKKIKPPERRSRPKNKVILKKVEDINDDNKEMYSSNFRNNNNIYANNNNKFEKEALLQLVKIEGFNKVFRVLSKPYFDRKIPLEKKIDEIVCNIGLLRTSLILMQIKFDYYDNSQNTVANYNHANYNGYNSNLLNTYSNHQSIPYSPPTASLSLPNFKTNNSYNSNEIEDKDIDIILDGKEERERSNESKYKKFQGQKEIEKDGYELGEHLHKESDGKIYKYLKHHLRVTKGFVFNCADRKCRSKGLYDTESMNFKIIHKHTIPYEQHNYILNKDKFNQYKTIFDDFIKRDCNEAQVFKNDVGNKLVKWYNN